MISTTELLLKVPIAVNCCVSPFAIVGFAGNTEIDCSTAAVTVNCAVPLIAAFVVEVAVIVIGPPAPTPVATPELLIVAIAVFAELQFTLTGPLVPSEKWPVAVNGCVNPVATLADAGATVIVCSTAVTLIGPDVPVIVALPESVAVTVWLPVLFNVTWNVPIPLVYVEFAGNTASTSELVKCTVPG